MLSCELARERLWPLDRPREYVAGEEEARTHLAACAACQGFFRRDAAVAEALRRHGVAEPAPTRLRERVFDELARQRAMLGAGPSGEAGGPSRRLAPWAAVAAVAVSVALGVFAPRMNARETLFVQDFLSRAVEADVVERADQRAISAFFMRELGVPVVPVELDQAELNRAMICLIKGKRAAMVEYDVDGRTVAHYRVPAGEAVGATANELRTASEAGIQVVRWSDEGFEHALVSDLPESDLRDLARRQFVSN